MENKINNSINIVSEMLNNRKYNDIQVFKDKLTYITANNKNNNEDIVVYYIKTKQDMNSTLKIKSKNTTTSSSKIIYILCFLDSNVIPQKYLDLENDFTQIFHLNHLQFNIMNHKLMPKFIKLSESEKKELSNTWDLNNLSKIKISDPASKYYDMKKNDVFKIIRPSNNSYEYITYRIVI